MSRRAGFSLLELMIVVAIVGILASVALPSYKNWVQQGNRSTAYDRLQLLLNAQERYFLANRQYAADLTTLGLDADNLDSTFYSISARQCTDDDGNTVSLAICVELIAEGNDDQAEDGDIVVNTIGRSELLVDGTDTVKKQL